MKKAMSYAKEFFHRADIFLLVMGLICAIFGIVVISSATASYHSAKYVIVQSASLILGVFAFVVMTVLDVDVLADKWQILCAFNVVFLLLLVVSLPVLLMRVLVNRLDYMAKLETRWLNHLAKLLAVLKAKCNLPQIKEPLLKWV